jgi:hypothetical protein
MTDIHMLYHENQFPGELRAIRSISGKWKEPGAESVTATSEVIPDGPR